MTTNDITARLQTPITVSELSGQGEQGTLSLMIPELYRLWREDRLLVERFWAGRLDQPEIVTYSHRNCLLPDDRIRLKKHPKAETLKIATWNVNSIRIRLPLLLSWLAEQQPDIVCLQETKVEDHQFPEQTLREAGYNSVFSGQKSYNGVAILSKFPLDNVQYGFKDGFDAENKRLVAAHVEGVRIVNVYVPQGQAEDSPKFQYKLEFLDRLIEELTALYSTDDPLVLLGDINIAPDDRDVVSPEAMQNVVSFHPLEHAVINRLKQWGLTDLFRLFHQEAGLYSWWDFRTRGFEKNEGMRIDHLWGTESISGICRSCDIDVNNRSQSKPSDHAPVMCVIENMEDDDSFYFSL